jgi:hypothetical protein
LGARTKACMRVRACVRVRTHKRMCALCALRCDVERRQCCCVRRLLWFSTCARARRAAAVLTVQVSFGNDLEQHLNFYVDCRQALKPARPLKPIGMRPGRRTRARGPGGYACGAGTVRRQTGEGCGLSRLAGVCQPRQREGHAGDGRAAGARVCVCVRARARECVCPCARARARVCE